MASEAALWAERNVISCNANGIQIGEAGTDGNTIAGNLIGTNAGGNAALGNQYGVIISGGSENVIGTNGDGVGDEVERNVISGNSFRGIVISGTTTQGNIVAGNYIGTDASGTTTIANGGLGISLGAPNNRIGVDSRDANPLGERNVISGNAGCGIQIWGNGQGNGNMIAGNYIGTDHRGQAVLGNGEYGVCVSWGIENVIGTNGDGVDDGLEGNVISGNVSGGILLAANARLNFVAGNRIGTDATGAAPLGNLGAGVEVNDGAQANQIGGSAASGNTIAYNSGAGVWIPGNACTGNTIQANSIYSNVGLGNRPRDRWRDEQ